jgi:c(7)-type cytochrome triheme protein
LLSLILEVFSLNAGAQEAPGDLQFERKDGDPKELINYPPSIFQHWVHRMRYRCDACHNDMFEMKAGSSTINHDSMNENKFCSSCHNGVTAFDAGFKNCNRCHVTEEK